MSDWLDRDQRCYDDAPTHTRYTSALQLVTVDTCCSLSFIRACFLSKGSSFSPQLLTVNCLIVEVLSHILQGLALCITPRWIWSWTGEWIEVESQCGNLFTSHSRVHIVGEKKAKSQQRTGNQLELTLPNHKVSSKFIKCFQSEWLKYSTKS